MRASLRLDSPIQRVAIAAGVAALFWIPLTATRVTAYLLAAGLLPGVAIAARSRFRLEDSLGLGTAIAPVVFGAVVLAAMVSGASMPVAAWAAVAAALLLFVLAARGPRAVEADADDTRRALTGLALLVFLAAIMSFALPLAKLWWRARDDSWFHAAVTEKLLRDGLPVTDPYFAGLRLQYMYFYHAILAACVSLTRIDALHAIIVVNAIALASCAAAFHALAGMFSRRAGPRLLGAALWLFGMNGWFYLFYALRLARALTGATHGAAELHHFFPWTPNGHATAMALISVEGNQFMFLDKFMLGTAFSLTFSLAASALFLLLSARRGDWSIRHDVVFFLALAGAMLLHPVTGITIATITAVVLALLLLVRAPTARGGPSYARLMAWLVAAVALTLPYIRSLMPRGEGGHAMLSFAFQPGVADGLFADILPALVFAVSYFRGAGNHVDTPERFGARPFTQLTLSGCGLLTLWSVLMLGVALFVDLTTNNETKFSFFLWLPLCVLATGCFERLWDTTAARRAAVALVASATIPLHMLYFHHAVRDRSALAISADEHAVYAWMRETTPRDAVFIEAADIVRVPVLADRDNYWGTEAYAHNWDYPAAEMSTRRALRDHVFTNGPDDHDVATLRALGRPVYVIERAPDGPDRTPAVFDANPRLRRAFTTPEISAWEVLTR